MWCYGCLASILRCFGHCLSRWQTIFLISVLLWVWFFRCYFRSPSFGTLQTALFLALLLTAVQFYIGNILEPKMIGKQVNLSPFVVLVALSLWAGYGELPVAILAIPLTSMLAIILAAFPDTRPLAVLLADDVGIFEEDGGAAT